MYRTYTPNLCQLIHINARQRHTLPSVEQSKEYYHENTFSSLLHTFYSKLIPDFVFIHFKLNKISLLFYLFLKIYLFYLFLAASGLRCCAHAAFSSCGEWGLLFVVVRGLLIAVASLVAEQGL